MTEHGNRIALARDAAERHLTRMDIIQVTHLEARVSLDPVLVGLYRQYLGAAFRAHVLTATEAAFCAESLNDWGWNPETDLPTRWAVSECVFTLMKAAHS